MSVSGRYPSLNDLGGERAEVLTMSVGGSISMMIIIILHEMIKVVAVIHSLQFEELVISQEIKSYISGRNKALCMHAYQIRETSSIG